MVRDRCIINPNILQWLHHTVQELNCTEQSHIKLVSLGVKYSPQQFGLPSVIMPFKRI